MINKYDVRLSDVPLASLEDGFLRERGSGRMVCLFCGAAFEAEVVYRFDEDLLVGTRAAVRHLSEAHGGPFHALLSLDRQQTGISEVQKTLMERLYEGRTDREIAAELGGKSASTIRNHRFQLRKRQKQAKVFLALMDLLERGEAAVSEFIDFPPSLSVADDRAIVTTEEARGILAKHLQEGDPPTLLAFPRKQKAKLVVLNRLAGLFEPGRRYSEKEVNGVLSAVYGDYVTLRRYLIDYGFLGRKRDGSEYWLR
jgi:DNA-binding CsgD family transcriptional regulator